MSELKMTDTAAAAGAGTPTPYVVAAPKKEDTEYTKKMKGSFSFFGPVTFLYAAFYAFCMYKNGSGITFPFFMAGSLLYLCFSLSKLEITLKKGSAFYMVSMILLGVSTFCTDDWRIINLNKTGIFFLMMSLLLKQFYDTSKWKLGKYLVSICEMVIMSLGEIARPFSDGRRYLKNRQGKKDRKIWYGLLGVVIAVPLFLIVLGLLSSADAVFREFTNDLLELIKFGNILNVVFRIIFIFFGSYLLVAHLCCRTIKEGVKDRRNGEPVLAITITGLLSLLYLVFSGIQIIYLFLGKMQLPADYTYAMYAREGFFQLLAVSILNLIIVLISLAYFKESKVLKAILTIMSLCTFIMIASSALRMIMYIRYFYLTFLRIFVLWALAVLFLLFIGVIINIYKEHFPLFRYSMAVITVFYIALSFMHPDYIIAKVNIANAPTVTWYDEGDTESWKKVWEEQREEGSFFQAQEPYNDFRYLATLSADAAPALIPYLAELDYDIDVFYEEDIWEALKDRGYTDIRRRSKVYGFGYYYLEKLQGSTENFSFRTYNISRHMALKNIEKYGAE